MEDEIDTDLFIDYEVRQKAVELACAMMVFQTAGTQTIGQLLYFADRITKFVVEGDRSADEAKGEVPSSPVASPTH